MKAVVTGLVFAGCSLLVGIPSVHAAPTAEETTLSGRVSALRQLAASASAGELQPEQQAQLNDLRHFIAQRGYGQEDHPAASVSSNELPVVILGRAQKSDAVPVDCREVQRRFYMAKAYWNQLLCVADRIVQLSAQPCPDLHCIKLLRKEAERIKIQIDQTYPLQWDQKDIKFSRSWTFEPAVHAGRIDSFLGKEHALTLATNPQLQFTGFRRLKWRDAFWQDLGNIPYTKVAVSEGRVDIVQELSVTNYCMESIRMTLALEAHLTGYEDRAFGVNLQF